MIRGRSAEFSKGTKNTIRRRAKGRCEKCGNKLKKKGSGTCHHDVSIAYARENGWSASRVSQASNGAYLCSECHCDIHET